MSKATSLDAMPLCTCHQPMLACQTLPPSVVSAYDEIDEETEPHAVETYEYHLCCVAGSVQRPP